MRLYNISEAELENCLDNPSSRYFAGADVVYVCIGAAERMLKIRVRGGAEPVIIDAFRAG